MFAETNSGNTITAPKKMKAKDRRKMQKEYSQLQKNIHGCGEGIPVDKGYKRTKMKFV